MKVDYILSPSTFLCFHFQKVYNTKYFAAGGSELALHTQAKELTEDKSVFSVRQNKA